jgi:hypothetical protein
MDWVKGKKKRQTSFVITQEFLLSPGQVCSDPYRKERPPLCLHSRTTHQGTLLQGHRQPPPCPQLGKHSQRKILTPRSFEDGHTHSATHLPVQGESWTCRMEGLTGCAPLCWGKAPPNSAGKSNSPCPEWEIPLSCTLFGSLKSRWIMTSCCSQLSVFRKTIQISGCIYLSD